MDWSQYAVGGAAARADSFTGLRPEFASGLYQMVRDARAAGIPLQITSAYRSPEVQARLFENALEKYGSEQAARKWVAPPGRSQHNHGTAADFAVNGSLIRDANSPEAQWIRDNAARYGLAVPMDWEPWQVELAGARGQPQPSAPSQQRPQTQPETLAAPEPPQQGQIAQMNQLALMQNMLPRTNALDSRQFQSRRPQNALMGFTPATNPYLRG